jgi:hypothetical protein
MDKINSQSVSTIVANCIACEGLVRIPAKAKASSMVRCPHCSRSFTMSQILEQSIPELEVVSEAEEQPEEVIPVIDRVSVRPTGDDGPREKLVVPHQLSAGAKRKRRHRRRNGSSQSPASENRTTRQREPGMRSERDERSAPSVAPPESNLSVSNQNSDAANGAVERPRSASAEPADRVRRSPKPSSSRPRQGEPSSLVEFLKIAFGGLFAFPIAYLLVLWIFSQDPLGLGPHVSKVAPWAIPVKLRGAEANDSERPNTGESEKDGNQDSDDEVEVDILTDLKGLDGLPGMDVAPDNNNPTSDDLIKTDIEID